MFRAKQNINAFHIPVHALRVVLYLIHVFSCLAYLFLAKKLTNAFTSILHCHPTGRPLRIAISSFTKPTSPVELFNQPGVGESKRTQWFVLLLNQRHHVNYFNKPGVGESKRTQWFVLLLNQRTVLKHS